MTRLDGIGIVRALAVAVAVTVTGMSSCRQTESRSEAKPAETTLTNIPATVKRFPIDAETFVLIPEAHPDERYFPDNLPEAFRDDGLQVLFSGQRLEIAPNDRLIGTPVHLVRIERRYGIRGS